MKSLKKKMRNKKSTKRKKYKFDGGLEEEMMEDLINKFNIAFENYKFEDKIIELRKGLENETKNFEFHHEKTTFGLLCRLEKMPNYSRIFKIKECVFFNIVAVGIEKEENRKKGFFRNIISEIEKFCEIQHISLIVTNILENNFAKTLNMNGFGIISFQFEKPAFMIYKDVISKDEILNNSYEIHCFKIFESTFDSASSDIW